MSMSPLISAAELARLLDSPDRSGIVLLDVRDAGEELFRLGHIPGARYLAFSETVCGPQTAESGRCPLPDREKLAAALGALGLSRETSVVVYGNRDFRFPARTWFTLRWMGMENVRVLDGNFPAWERAGLPIEAGDAQNWEKRVFVPGTPLERVFTADEIEADLEGKREMTLIDGRSPAALAAGRIPGSRGRLSDDNLDADGLMKPASELRSDFLGVLGDRAPESVVHTCAAGIRATVNLLASRKAGLPSKGVYVGSFTEWAKDPDRPVEVGM